MAFAIEKETGENVLLDARYHVSSKSEPFAFGVSDRAIFVPATKSFALTNDPFYFRRVPLASVREIRVQRLRPLFLYLLAIAMVVVGVYTTVGMFSEEYAQSGGRVRGWPIAVAVGGLVLPFAARGRYGLVVSQTDATYRWKPPLVIDRPSKEQIAETLSSIVVACRKAGLRVVDDRTAAV